MSESNNKTPSSDALQRTLGEILASEPVLEGRNGQTLRRAVEGLLKEFVDDPQLKTKMLGETKVGFGMALGKFLAWKVWTEVEKNDKRRSAAKNRTESLTLKVPETVLDEVREAWPAVKTAFLEKVGFPLTDPTLSPESQDDWSLEIQGGILSRKQLPSDWFEPLVDFLVGMAPGFLSLGFVKELLDEVRSESPVVGEELERLRIPLTAIYHVLVGLLEEGVSIREMETILTALALNWEGVSDRSSLLSAARTALSPWICRDYISSNGRVRAVRIGHRIEEMFVESMRYVGSEQVFMLDMQQKAMVVVLLKQACARLASSEPLVLLSNGRIRRELQKVIRLELPNMVVLSENELHLGCPLEVLASVDFKQPVRADSIVQNPGAATIS